MVERVSKKAVNHCSRRLLNNLQDNATWQSSNETNDFLRKKFRDCVISLRGDHNYTFRLFSLGSCEGQGPRQQLSIDLRPQKWNS